MASNFYVDPEFHWEPGSIPHAVYTLAPIGWDHLELAPTLYISTSGVVDLDGYSRYGG